MNKHELAAVLWIAGGQCGRCANAQWRGRQVVGCDLGHELIGPLGEVARIQAALLFQLARQPRALPCVARQRLELTPGAYLAEDAPRAPPG